MNKKTRNFISTLILILLAITFTFLVKYVDVQPIGPNNSSVGFSTLNKAGFDIIGTNMDLYNLTEYLGFLPIILVLIYSIIGLAQLIKRRSLFKVDKSIIVSGVFYIIVIGLYILFEILVINYRPILIGGQLEASYPSSHIMLAICLCGSSVLLNKQLFNNIKVRKIINILIIILMIIIVLGRVISGVHWASDIIGSFIISFALLMMHYSLIKCLKNKTDN